MRILVYLENFLNPTLVFIYNEIVCLSENEKVKLVCRNRVNDDSFPFEDLSILKRRRNRFFKKIDWILWKWDVSCNFRDRKLKKEIDGVIKTFQPELLHGHFGYESLIMLENYSVDIPCVLSFHGYDASEMLKKKSYVSKLNALFAKKRIYPVFVSDYMKEQVLKAGLKFGKCFKLYYGVDTGFFKRNSRKKTNKVRFVQVSSLNAQKGHPFTIEAFRLFHQQTGQDWELIFTGDGKMMQRYKSMVESCGLSDRIKFTGYQTRDEVKNLLENADVFIHHSITGDNGQKEGIPNAIMEAMSMELPVLSTFHAGIPELVEDGVNGFLVPERDVVKYAEKIHQISEWNYSSKNRIKVEQSFNFINHMEKLREIYREVLI